ncbi:HAD-IIA family hydrolase [Neolewinella antarctica]|uniref:HAD superfamily hydrolase (TIGR01450 family) n=1 Tax=Neolewinella antarctica TaxID=442734 RepID=A0ABX0XCY7_9BACT|nr:HAD-IIA family hydrolase [Neolewinella antarctica]NJC26759.1 HAD superfamily hydrolase (TIGR01450 family) [Neolewinella antarctica]
MTIEKFSEISQPFKVILLDSYGVLRNHDGLIPGVVECVNRLRAEGKHLRVLTNNAARSPAAAAKNLKKYGLRGIPAAEIITSGATTRHFLQYKIRTGKVVYLGTPQSAEYIIGAGLEAVHISEVDLDDLTDIKAVAFLDDEGYDKNVDVNHVINLLRHCQVPVVVANTDLLYPVSKDNVALATGSVARLVEYVLGRRFIQFGKPASQMFQFAFESLLRDFPDLTHADVLMVGDTLHTDILGGNTFGVSTALVLSGNTRAERAETEISSSGIIPDFIIQSIGA